MRTVPLSKRYISLLCLSVCDQEMNKLQTLESTQCIESWIERMNRTWKRFQIDCLEILVGEIISNGICWIGIGIDSFRSPSLLTCYLDRPVLYLWYWGCVTDMRSYWDFREVRIIPIREMYMNYTIACLSRCYQYCLMRKRSETAWYSNSKRKW
jgi:hypothetical protein